MRIARTLQWARARGGEGDRYAGGISNLISHH